GDRPPPPTLDRSRRAWVDPLWSRGVVLGWTAGLRRLLERVRELDQGRLAPGAPHERDPDRQPLRVAGRNADERIAGQRGALGAAATELIAVHQIDRPRRRRRGRDQRVEL